MGVPNLTRHYFMCHVLFVFLSLNFNRRIILIMVSRCAFDFFWRREHNPWKASFSQICGHGLKILLCALCVVSLTNTTKFPFLHHWLPRKKWPNLLSKKRVKKWQSLHIIDTVKRATLTLTTESICVWACMVDMIIALTENDGTLSL